MQKFILIFCICVSILSCSKEESLSEETQFSGVKDFKIDNSSARVGNYSYDDFLNDAYILKSLTTDAILNSDGMNFENDEAVNNYVIDYFEKNNTISYINFDNFNNSNTNNFDFEEYGFSENVTNYFNSIINLNRTEDYEGMIQLLDEYKNDLKNDNDLYALSGIFATIEAYTPELLGQTSSTLRIGDCPPSGQQIATGAINGAVGGAISGATWGSFLGPAGSLAGALGGAIVGSLIGSITSIASGSITNGDNC